MIHVVLGTKAQLVKMAPVMARMAERRVPYRLIHTGQHQATMDEMLREFRLREPDVRLHTGSDIVSAPRMAVWFARVLYRCVTEPEAVFGSDRTGIVLAHGDTFSTLLGALMGRVAGMRVAHVESGLRSFRLLDPFPEELTRLAVFRLSHLLLCPGEWAVRNVSHLGRDTVDTGANTLVDTVSLALGNVRRRDHVPVGEYAVASIHRYENIFRREAFGRLVQAVELLAVGRKVLFVLHPPTERQLRRYGLDVRLRANSMVELRPRYAYFDFLTLIENAQFIATDGGSIQEETSYLGVPCLLLRRSTERQEGLGANVCLSGLEPDIIREFAGTFERWRRSPRVPSVRPSDRIIDALVARLGKGPQN